MFLLSELAGYESGHLVNLLITTNWENNNLSPSLLVSTSSIPCSRYFTSLIIPVSISLSGKMGEGWKVLGFCKFLRSGVCKSVTVCFINRFLQKKFTVYFKQPVQKCSKVILKLFYLPKVILKLHLDGRLQVTFIYYLYYKRDLSYCQTLWLVKC